MTCWHFKSHTLQSIFFRVIYPALFIDLKHPIFADSRYPRFMRSIATPPHHNFFKNDILKIVLGRLPTFLEPQINLTLNPPSPNSCVPSTIVAPSHDHIFFLNSLSLFSKYRHIQIVYQDSYIPLLFEE